MVRFDQRFSSEVLSQIAISIRMGGGGLLFLFRLLRLFGPMVLSQIADDSYGCRTAEAIPDGERVDSIDSSRERWKCYDGEW